MSRAMWVHGRTPEGAFEVVRRPWATSTRVEKKRTSRHTQAGIGHSAATHRGGHAQDRIRRRQRAGVESEPQVG